MNAPPVHRTPAVFASCQARLQLSFNCVSLGAADAGPAPARARPPPRASRASPRPARSRMFMTNLLLLDCGPTDVGPRLWTGGRAVRRDQMRRTHGLAQLEPAGV